MAVRAAFIGIDKHADAGIRDLTGACRDATALWALFADTIPSLEATLLVNEVATVSSIRRVLQTVLAEAGSDDTVIISFSGHGSRDHRLAAHDTKMDALHDTTVAMEELASAFRISKARAILCILDCCFSGGAPARVLEDSPIPREPATPLDALAGNGRLLLAACKIDEVAYECPRHRQGLLTRAVTDVFQNVEGPTSLVEAVDRVMERVRAEAGRMGIQQTPVLLGHVEGGLMLPCLVPGERYFAAFPELRSAVVGPAIEELSAFGIPQSVLQAWASQFPGGLNALQLQAVNECRILDGDSVLVVAPTSSGKTFIGEMAAARAVEDGRKAVFLLPYKALVNEKFDQFKALYGGELELRVVRCTGDYQDDTSALVRGKYDLALLTYEMYLNVVVSNPAVLHSLGLIVLDEAQFITDPVRGISVELLLTHLLAARERGIAPQLIALSAVIGNVNDFDAWLQARLLVTRDRPVPLIEGVLDRSGVFQYLCSDGTEAVEQILPAHQIMVRREKASAQDMIVPLVKKLVADGENVIVFRNRRGPAEGCAKYLAKDLDLSPADAVASRLPHYDLTTTSIDLRVALRGGTAFHNANLTRDERVVVEQAFRAGETRVLVATTTVAAGINTPADTVIIAEQEFVGEDGRPFTVAEYKNMAGRAGRLGFAKTGKAIIIADTSMQRRQLFQRYVLGTPEALLSSFDSQHVETWLLRLLAQVHQVPRADVGRLLANTFGGYLANRGDPGWRNRIETEIDGLVDQMIRLDLAEQEGDNIQLTLLGRACGRSQLSLASTMRLVEILRQFCGQPLTAVHLMGLVQMLEESDGGYTPLMKKGRKEAQWATETARRYGQDVVRALQRYAEDEFKYYGRCKRASLLFDWIDGTPLEALETRYSATPYQGKIGHGDIRRFVDLTRMNLRSAHQIATIMFVGSAPSEEEIEELLRRLEVGIPCEGLSLLDLPVILGRGEYLALLKAGITAAADLWACASEQLIKLLGERRAAELAERHSEAAEKSSKARNDPGQIPAGAR
jgi:helicase